MVVLMGLMIAHYRAELSDSGYRARVRIDLQSEGTTKRVEYTHPHEFGEMTPCLKALS